MGTKKDAFNEVSDELVDLFLAWKEYLLVEVYKKLARTKYFFNVSIMFFAFCLGLAIWLIKSSVYAQGDAVVTTSLSGFPFEDIFSWIMGGGLLSVILSFAQRNYTRLKRVFDVIVSSAVLAILLPLFIIIAILTKIDSKGPVFFKQNRIGHKGKVFGMWKFRTMREKAEFVTGPVWVQKNDPRITKIGSFLRKTHLDELPQLINVVCGDMSLIGPRPERPEFSGVIGNYVPNFMKRLEVKPGITGLAQVRYRHGISIKDAARKLKYDLLYIRQMCWVLDFKILFWTAGMILTGERAR